MCLTGEPRQGWGRCVWGGQNLSAILSYFLTVAAPDLLDPKSATHNTKPRLSFSTKPVTLTPREESEVREKGENSTFSCNFLFRWVNYELKCCRWWPQ